MMKLTATQQAIRDDACRRLPQLFEYRKRLLADQDDPFILSEIVAIEGQIRNALHAVEHPECES